MIFGKDREASCSRPYSHLTKPSSGSASWNVLLDHRADGDRTALLSHGLEALLSGGEFRLPAGDPLRFFVQFQAPSLSSISLPFSGCSFENAYLRLP